MSSRANYSVTKQRRRDNKQAQTWHEHLHHSFTETDWWEKRDGKNNSITHSGRDHGGFWSSRHSGGLTRSKTVWRQKLMLRSGTGKVDEDSEHITSYKLWTVAISSVNPLNIHINVEKDAAHDFRCFLVILTFFRSFWEKNSSFSLSRINLFASLFCMFNLRCSGYLVCLFSALNDTAVVPAGRLRVTGFKPWTGSTASKKHKESNRDLAGFPLRSDSPGAHDQLNVGQTLVVLTPTSLQTDSSSLKPEQEKQAILEHVFKGVRHWTNKQTGCIFGSLLFYFLQ